MPRSDKPTEIDHIDPRWEEGRDYQLVCGRDCFENFNELGPPVNQKKSNCFLPWRWVRDGVGVVPEEPGDLALFLVGADIETDTPGEWVLLEFLEDDWYNFAKTTSCRSHREVNVESLQEGQRRSREQNPDMYEVLHINLVKNGHRWIKENPEEFSEKVSQGRARVVDRDPSYEDRRAAAAKSGFQEWKTSLTKEEWEIRNNTISLSTKESMKNLPTEVKEKLVEGGKEGALVQHSQKWMCTKTGRISTPCGLTAYQRARGIDTSKRVELTPEEKAFIFLWGN
jgi:hypothetical protein